MKLRPILGFKVKSQLCAWMTSAAVCTEGFEERLSPSCVCGRPLQLCVQRVFVRILRKDLQLCAQRSAAVCVA